MTDILSIIKDVNKAHKNENLIALGNKLITCEKLPFPSINSTAAS